MKTITTLAVFFVSALISLSLSIPFHALAQVLPPAGKQKIEETQKPVRTIGM